MAVISSGIGIKRDVISLIGFLLSAANDQSARSRLQDGGLLLLLTPADGRSLNNDRDLPGLHWTFCVGRVRLYHPSYIVHKSTSHRMPRMHDARWIIETELM